MLGGALGEGTWENQSVQGQSCEGGDQWQVQRSPSSPESEQRCVFWRCHVGAGLLLTIQYASWAMQNKHCDMSYFSMTTTEHTLLLRPRTCGRLLWMGCNWSCPRQLWPCTEWFSLVPSSTVTPSSSMMTKRWKWPYQYAREQAAELYATDIQNLVLRQDKCLNQQGDYVEK